MIKEFALDPAVPAQSFKDCRFFLDALRIENGKVLARFPKNWKRMVYDAAQMLHQGKVELSRIEASLGAMTACALFSCGRPSGDPAESWLKRALIEHERSPFTAIITSEAKPGTPYVIAADDAYTSREFQSAGQHEIARTAREIVECVGLLLRAARVVKLVDPHFKASAARWRRGLQRLVEIVPPGAVVEIHRQDSGELEGNQRSWFDGPVQRVLKNGVIVKVFLHPKNRMHNRYILTEQGGASFGTGLDDHEDGDEGVTNEDDVVLLTEAQRHAKWSKYESGVQPLLVLSERDCR